jgi:hypothetical protein
VTGRKDNLSSTVSPEDRDAAVPLDDEAPPVCGPVRMGLFSSGVRDPSPPASVCVGRVDVTRAVRAGSNVRNSSGVGRPRRLDPGRYDEPGAPASHEEDAATRHLRAGEGERR